MDAKNFRYCNLLQSRMRIRCKRPSFRWQYGNKPRVLRSLLHGVTTTMMPLKRPCTADLLGKSHSKCCPTPTTDKNQRHSEDDQMMGPEASLQTGR